MSDITWTTEDVSIDVIRAHLGESLLKGILMHHQAVSICLGRAAYAWDANDRETYAVYRTLARICREGLPR